MNMWFQRTLPSLARTVLESALEIQPSQRSSHSSPLDVLPTIPLSPRKTKEKLPCRVRARCAFWGSLVVLLVSMCSLSFEPWSISTRDTSTASPIGKILCVSARSNNTTTTTNADTCPFQSWSTSDPISCRLAWFLYSFGLLIVGASVAWRLYSRTPQQLLSRRRWQTAVHIILIGLSSIYISLILWATYCNSCWLPSGSSVLSGIWYFLISAQTCLLTGTLGAELELCYEIRKHKLEKSRTRKRHQPVRPRLRYPPV